MSKHPVLIVGGGPAGSVAALCLRKQGHEVLLFEKQKFPRYQIGESLLPGTFSILTRLGVYDKIRAANFTKKPAATFIWGQDSPPWSFTFATPKTAPWVFDHSYQVNRAEFDKILLDSAAENGAVIKNCEVTDIELSENGKPAIVHWKNNERQGSTEGTFVIDASGSRGLIAKKLKLRRYDPYFRNMAVWSYFKGGKRFKGDLEGNILSVTFKEGWIWLIPLKDDIYSVGVITDKIHNARMREIGIDAFFQENLNICPLAMEILETAKRVEMVRVVREWAYDATTLATNRAFLCGDSACFIDPLFSQGVHLATYSATLAAAAIDHLHEHPEDSDDVHSWYDRTYREAYNRYHKFLSAFYTNVDEKDSVFWSNRKITSARDTRFEGKEWFTSLTGQNVEAEDEVVNELDRNASTLAHLWSHSKKELSDQFDDNELAARRMQWGNQLVKEIRSFRTIHWRSKQVRAIPSFKVNPTSFKLERQLFLGDENGRMTTRFVITEAQRDMFASLITNPLSYRDLVKKLKEVQIKGIPLQVILGLLEENFLEGRDQDGNPVKIQTALRFGGVGADDDMS